MSIMPLSEEQRRKQEEERKRNQPGLIRILAEMAGSGPVIDPGPILRSNVGNNMDNEDEDVRTVRNMLDILTERTEANRETDPEGRPLGMITQQMDDDIRTFQKDNDLKVDGYLEPGGETITAMAAQLKKKQEAAQTPSSSAQKPAEEKKEVPFPPRKPEIIKDIPNDTLAEEYKTYEAPISHLYKDSKGNITVGIGRMLKNEEEAQNLPFVKYEKGKEPRPATPEEISQAFKKLKESKAGGYKAEYYKPSEKNGFDDIRISDEDMKALAISNLFEHVGILKNRFKDFDQFPLEAKKALLDLQFNTGLPPKEWTEFYKAVNNKDWKKAAKESGRPEVGERSKDIEDLFKKAGSDHQ